MAERLEITDLDSGEQEVVTVAEGHRFLTVTADGRVLVQDEPAGALLQLVPIAGGRRLESAVPGGKVVVSGEELYCKDLRSGDTFELGNYRLRWKGDTAAATAAAVAAPSPSRRGRTAAPRAGHGVRPTSDARPRRPSRSGPRWPVFTAIALAIATAALLLRTCDRGDWPRTPQHYVDLARAQFGGGRLEEALRTLEIALREASGPTRREAEVLQQEIRGALVAAADAVAAQRARKDLDLLLGFRDRYLRTDAGRPAAREFVRLCDEWLTEHEDRLTGNRDGARLLGEVRGLRRAHVERAELESPEIAADVEFAAQAHLRFQVREYKAAVARFDAWLARHPDDDRMRQLRDEMLAAGEEWLRDRLSMVERMLQRDDRNAAASLLSQLDRYAVLPQWDGLVEPLRARVR